MAKGFHFMKSAVWQRAYVTIISLFKSCSAIRRLCNWVFRNTPMVFKIVSFFWVYMIRLQQCGSLLDVSKDAAILLFPGFL